MSSANVISFEDGIENIDIGGPTLIRANAKVKVYCIGSATDNLIIHLVLLKNKS